MTLWRQVDLATVGPVNLRERARTVNDAIYARLAELAGELIPHAGFDEVATVVIQVPYGIVRQYVGGPVPEWLDRIVVAAVEGAIGALQSDRT